MSHSLESTPVATPCSAFGDPPDYLNPTQSAFDNSMVLGQNNAGVATWQHLHKRVHSMFPGVLPMGYDIYAIGDTGVAGTVTLWSPLATDLCDQNEVWIKNNSSQFPLTINLVAGNFDYNNPTLVLPAKTGATGNTGGGSVHLVCAPGTNSWLVISSHNL